VLTSERELIINVLKSPNRIALWSDRAFLLGDFCLIMFQFIRNFKSREVDGEISVEDLVEFIKNPDFQRKLEIGRARTAGKGSPEYDRIKSSLMCFIPTFKHEYMVNAKSIIEPTGYLYLDFDYQSKFNFSQYPFIVAAWSSLSNEGLGVLVKVNNLHQESLLKATEYIALMFGLECDRRAVSRDRNCVISFDPEIYYNPQHTEVSLPEFEVQSLEVDEKGSSVNYTINNNKVSSQVSLFVDKIRFSDYDELVSLLDFKGENYIDFGGDGFKYTETGIYGIIKEGKRFDTLLNHCRDIKGINKNVSKKYISIVAHESNKKFCLPRLEDSEVDRIINRAFEYDGPLYRNKKVRFVFNPEKELSEEYKKSVRSKASGETKKQETFSKILETLNSWDFNLHGKITLLKVSKLSGLSYKTVKRKSKELKEIIASINVKKC
jgi:hypothetical protein